MIRMQTGKIWICDNESAKQQESDDGNKAYNAKSWSLMTVIKRTMQRAGMTVIMRTMQRARMTVIMRTMQRARMTVIMRTMQRAGV